MPRLHLMEIEDQAWCPAVLRDPATAYLRVIMRVTGMDLHLLPALQRALRDSGAERVVDLCSGGAGPLQELSRHIDVPCLLTDLYPNAAAFDLAQGETGGRVSGHPSPVDATSVPAQLKGLSTLFNAFHHFRPTQARAILEAAVRDGQPIAAFEVVGRNLPTLLGVLASPLPVWVLMLTHIRPWRAAWLFFTYVIPLVPLLVVFDGLVSCMRVYSSSELEELVSGLDGFDWRIEPIPLGLPGAVGTVLVGLPKR